MRRSTWITATLFSSLILSGCEWLTDVDLTGSMEPLTAEQTEVQNFNYSAESTIVSAQRVEFKAVVDCTAVEDDDSSFQQRPATGSLIIDDFSIEIIGGWCEGISVAEEDVGQGELQKGSIFIGFNENDNEQLEPLVIWFVTYTEDEAIAPLASLAGQSIISVGLADGGLEGTNDAIFLGTFQPAVEGQQSLVTASQDLQLLIGDDNAFTNRVLRRAVWQLQAAASDRNWDSADTLSQRRGSRAFRAVSYAINNIEIIADNTSDGVLMAALDEISNSLLDTMRALAASEIAAAVDGNGDMFLIDRAQRVIDYGDSSRARDSLRHATRLYGLAWYRAVRAQ